MVTGQTLNLRYHLTVIEGTNKVFIDHHYMASAHTAINSSAPAHSIASHCSADPPPSHYLQLS